MAEKVKIRFFYAGGTIGMQQNAEGSLVAPSSDAEFRAACLHAMQEWQTRNNVEVEYEFFTGKDSTNMTPDDWQAMLYRVNEAQEEGYDAVCFAHGTDTLVYTASAIAFGLRGREIGKSALRIPVVLTGSQNPIFEFGGDGNFNLQNLFRTALEAIKHSVADVMINFGYDVFLGCRAIKVSERAFNAFEAPSELGRVGFIDAFGVHLLLHRLTRKQDTEKGEIQPKFSKGVLIIDLGPGTEPGMLESLVKNGGVMAMVMKSPGEGNICTEGTYNMLPFVRMATERCKVPILIASKFLGGAVGRAHYELGRAALEAGAIACYDTNDCAVEVKVRWLLGNGIATNVAEVRRSMQTNYIGEVSPQDI
jgi:L-asparaginase